MPVSNAADRFQARSILLHEGQEVFEVFGIIDGAGAAFRTGTMEEAERRARLMVATGYRAVEILDTATGKWYAQVQVAH